MSDLCNLIKWLVTYAVSGGFWHFIAVYLIVVAIVRIFRFVRVNVNVKREVKDTNTNA